MYDTKGFCIRPHFEHFLWDTGVPRHPEITNNLLHTQTRAFQQRVQCMVFHSTCHRFSSRLEDLPLLFSCFARAIKVVVVGHATARTTQPTILVINLFRWLDWLHNSKKWRSTGLLYQLRGPRTEVIKVDLHKHVIRLEKLKHSLTSVWRTKTNSQGCLYLA